MTVFNYLKEQLTEFVNTFKGAKVNYEYDELAKLHTIEVLPQAIFDSDEFSKWECDFFKQAYSTIPGEDVSFISEDAYFGLDEVQWSIQGEDYQLCEKFTIQPICCEVANTTEFTDMVHTKDLSSLYFNVNYLQAA